MHPPGRSFEFVQGIPFAREDVYLVFRDRSRELIPLLPNIESVTELERSEPAPGRHSRVNRWQGSPTAVPRFLQAFVSAELTQWLDFAEWSDAEYCVRWRMEMPQAKGLFTCEGVNSFEQDGAATLVRLRGTLTLRLERLPGMPEMVARRVAKPLENWLLGVMRPNMLAIPEAVSRFLATTR